MTEWWEYLDVFDTPTMEDIARFRDFSTPEMTQLFRWIHDNGLYHHVYFRGVKMGGFIDRYSYLSMWLEEADPQSPHLRWGWYGRFPAVSLGNDKFHSRFSSFDNWSKRIIADIRAVWRHEDINEKIRLSNMPVITARMWEKWLNGKDT